MINIAICGNDTPQLDLLEKSIVKCLFDENELNIDIYDNTAELLETLPAKRNYYDLLFTETQIKKANGFALAEAIRKNNLDTEIVFLSEDMKEVLKAFKYRAFDYIVKPVTPEAIQELIERYKLYHYSKTDEYFSFKTSNTENRIKLSSVLYFYSSGRKTTIVTGKQHFEFYSKLDDVETVVDSNDFLRIHQSYLVNLHYIRYIIHNDVVLDNEDYLPISRNRQKYVKDAYMKAIT